MKIGRFQPRGSSVQCRAVMQSRVRVACGVWVPDSLTVSGLSLKPRSGTYSLVHPGDPVVAGVRITRKLAVRAGGSATIPSSPLTACRAPRRALLFQRVETSGRRPFLPVASPPLPLGQLRCRGPSLRSLPYRHSGPFAPLPPETPSASPVIAFPA